MKRFDGFDGLTAMVTSCWLNGSRLVLTFGPTSRLTLGTSRPSSGSSRGRNGRLPRSGRRFADRNKEAGHIVAFSIWGGLSPATEGDAPGRSAAGPRAGGRDRGELNSPGKRVPFPQTGE